MPPTIGNLRRSVVAAGVLLVVVLAAFLGVARHGRHGLHLDLPGRLGVDISQTSDGYTYSQSSKGHTLFTIKASKVIELKGNRAELHDVTITLYGPEGTDRTDRISGNEFTYDRKAGLVRAAGQVQIDFASPAMKQPVEGQDHGASAAAADANSTIHVVTSGVTFNQSTGDATTDQPVQFTFTRAQGSAVGASYNSKTGLLVLNRQVALVTSGAATGGGTDAVIHGEHAQLLRASHQVFLVTADAIYGQEHSTSDQAVVTFRQDGSAQHIDARGHVHLTTADGGQVRSSTAEIDLNSQSQPELANLLGGVTYDSNQNGEAMQGSAAEGTLTFASAPAAPAKGRPGAPPGTEEVLHHAQFRTAVNFALEQHSLPGDPAGSAKRTMRANRVDVDFVPGPGNKALAQHALGTGGAEVKLRDVPSKGAPKTTTIDGDQLLATLADGRELKVLDGTGHTRVVDLAPDGAVDTSTGDTLHMTFVSSAGSPAPKASAAEQGAEGAAQVDTAVQQGDVVMLQTPAPGAKTKDGIPQSPLHATAARAEYHAADQVLHLTGDPHLRNDAVALTAERVDYRRDTGDAVAIGDVRSTYVQQPGPGNPAPTLGGDGPVHVTADRAELTRSTNVSIFYGSQAMLARMWQGGDAVAAPVLELGREQDTLDAHGAAQDYGPVVHATFGVKSSHGPVHAQASPQAQESASAQKSASAQGRALSGQNGSPSRVTSVALHYSDKTRRADFRGSVTAEQPTGVVHSDQAQLYLTPAAPGKPSELDCMVAIGHVVIVQPGRRGTGEKLVYTAADGQYVLTGTPQQRPRVVDAEKGTITGAALIFRGGNDSVEVASQVDGTPANHPTRTVTDTRSPH